MKFKLYIVTIIVVLSLGLCSCGQSPEEQYALIKEELKITASLQANYFAEYYDTKELEKAKKKAEEAVKLSNEEVYKDVLKELQVRNEEFSEFISSEVDKLYNVQTSENRLDEYPFAVKKDRIPKLWSAEPVLKQMSSHPTYIAFEESNTLDEPDYIVIHNKDSWNPYSMSIENVSTKKIIVEDENREMQDVLVNTQVNFKYMSEMGFTPDKYVSLDERPAYLFENKTGNVILVLPNYDGKDYYVQYNFYEYEGF